MDEGGRPLKLDDEERREQVIEAAKQGMSKAGCSRAAGITTATLNSYLEKANEENADKRFVQFFDKFKRARSEGEKELVTEARSHGDAKFLLATSFDYSKKEKREIMGEDGGPVEVDAGVNATIEDYADLFSEDED